MKEVLNEINETLGYTYFDPTDITTSSQKIADKFAGKPKNKNKSQAYRLPA
jgi:hypothetical protein